MNLQTAIEDGLYDSVRQILDHLGRDGVKIVFANQGGTEPKETYCLLNIIEQSRVGRVQETVGSPMHLESENWYTNYYTLSVQVSFIGSQSGDVMFDFADSVFSSRQCIEFWQKRYLGPLTHSSVRRIPQLRDTKWVENYNIDLKLSCAVQSHETIDWIEYFTYSGNLVS